MKANSGRAWVRLLALPLLAACATEAPEGGFVLPRGAPISIRINEPISAASHVAGETFSASLDGPISDHSVIFAPDGAAVEGIVDEIADDPAGPEVAVRLVSLRLPDGTELPLETDPVLRSARNAEAAGGGSPGATTNALTGLEEKIRYLAETDGPEEPAAKPSGREAETVVIPQDSRMVFTLRRDAILPPPAGTQ